MRVKVELKTPSSLGNVFLNIHQCCSCSATKAEIVGLFPEEDVTEGSWVGGLQALMRVKGDSVNRLRLNSRIFWGTAENFFVCEMRQGMQ